MLFLIQKSLGSCPFQLGCMLLFNLRSLALGYNLSLASLNEWLYLLILIVILIAGSSFSALFSYRHLNHFIL